MSRPRLCVRTCPSACTHSPTTPIPRTPGFRFRFSQISGLETLVAAHTVMVIKITATTTAGKALRSSMLLAALSR